jgi:hypothetical protein
MQREVNEFLQRTHIVIIKPLFEKCLNLSGRTEQAHLKLIIPKVRLQTLRSGKHEAKLSRRSCLVKLGVQAHAGKQCAWRLYLRPDELAVLVRDEAILGEDVVVIGDDCGREN